MKQKPQVARAVGLTKSVGYEVGARKTLEVSPEQAWDFITSQAGLALWLGKLKDFKWEEGQTYETQEGAVGELRVVNPGVHFRLTWQPEGWARPSTIQVRLIPRGGRTVIAFHHEHLPGLQQRDAMRKRWQKALDELAEVFATKGEE